MPLEIIRPRILPRFVLMPCARDIASFAPVARSEQPSSVPKNQYSMAISAMMKISVMKIGFCTETSRT